jgi:secreted PhoX family phosphatase
MTLSRRNFLGRTVLAGIGASLVGNLETVASAAPAAARGKTTAGYGPLVADRAGRLSLPRGFSYRVVTHAGETRLESGEPTPEKHDGMATFPRAGGGCVIVYNHEINRSHNAAYPVPALPGLTYDPGAPGGCTVVEVDEEGKRVTEFVGLAGTSTNCAGGRTPWNTWLSCEETEERAGNGLQLNHGYVFEVDPYVRAANQDPQPIKALGRFAHEAIVVDPNTGHLYETEDASSPNGLFYRYTPPSAAMPLGTGKLRELGDTDGTLEAMRATDPSGLHVDDLSRATEVGTRYDVTWTNIPDRDAATTSTRKQPPSDQVTRARKLEGAWWDERGCYFVASFARSESPGLPHDGQVWFYDPLAGAVELKLRFAVDADDTNTDGPDNITVSPYGGVIMAEDGEGQQHLFGATAEGATYPMARNDLNVGTAQEPEFSEFTGPVYSPDGKYLFANVQTPGIMYAITGPWRRG